MRVWFLCLLLGTAVSTALEKSQTHSNVKHSSVTPIKTRSIKSLEESDEEERDDSTTSSRGTLGENVVDPIDVESAKNLVTPNPNEDEAEVTPQELDDELGILGDHVAPAKKTLVVEVEQPIIPKEPTTESHDQQPQLLQAETTKQEPAPVPNTEKSRPLFAENSDEEAEMTSMAYQDLTNLYHAHDAASLAPMQGTIATPHPFVQIQGFASSIVARQRARTCSPNLFQVKEAPRAENSAKFRWDALTANDVLQHVISTLSMIRMGKVPETPFSNVDGRISHPVLGSMGGDAGEFILALQAFETVAGREFDSFQVATLLSDFLIYVNKPSFALQTDDAALVNVCKTTGVCLHEGFSLDNPPPQKFQSLREVLIKPAYIGCAHIKHMLEVKNFGVRKELVEHFILAFYNLLWGVPENTLAPMTLHYVRAKLSLQVLQGPHTEGAILRVGTLGCQEYFPMLVPEAMGVSVAIMHDDAVNAMRAFTAAFFAEQARKMGYEEGAVTDDERLATEMRKLADTMYAKALILDNGNTPIFTLNFPPACCGGA